ncbi:MULTISPECIES: hypothetical protein [Bacteroides]|uniref:hypothetical protein n=1 Tax=Bacteroides TaxID=816 RepID=UPI00202DD1E4|nr:MULTISPECIES: hypothetical protein [Bacteroides]MDV6195221.1 hypothetical protein [Bacteroides hominis (ex Liu et al. 2022)]
MGHELVFKGDLAINGGIPPQLNSGFIQVVDHGLGRFNGFPTFQFRLAVVLLKYLHIRIYGKFAALQLEQQAAFTRADLAGGLIAAILVDERLVAAPPVIVVFLQQTGFALWERMLVPGTHFLAKGDDGVTHQPLVNESVLTMQGRHAHLLSHHGVQDLGVQDVFRLTLRVYLGRMLLVEVHRLAVTFQSFIHGRKLFLQIILRIGILRVVSRPDSVCQAVISDQRLPPVASFPENTELTFANMLFIISLT